MEDEMIASKSKPTTIWDFIGDLDFDVEELKRRYDIERDRRLNRGSAPLYVPAKDGKFANFGKDPWAPPLTRPALHDHVQVIIAGGGFGDLLAGAGRREGEYKGIRVIEQGRDLAVRRQDLSEAANHSGNGCFRGPGLPCEPLGLQLYEGRPQWRAHWVERQTGGRRGISRDRGPDRS